MKKKFTIEVDMDTEELGESSSSMYNPSRPDAPIRIVVRKPDPEMLKSLGVYLPNPNQMASLLHELGHAIGNALDLPAHLALRNGMGNSTRPAILNFLVPSPQQYALRVEAEKEAWDIVSGTLPGWDKERSEAIKAYERVLQQIKEEHREEY